MKRALKALFVFTLPLFLMTGCSEFLDTLMEEDEIPTKTRMEGVWKVAEAYNEQDSSIIDNISINVGSSRIPTLFHLSSDNTVISTAAPMVMYMVYGENKYTEIASAIDQVFNYAELDFTGGEFFISGGVVERFTLEMKLEGLPGQKSLTELLGMIGIGNDYLDQVVYHKFYDVQVTFSESSNDTMYWELDEVTEAVYNTKNDRGEYVLWQGWDTDSFSRCSFKLIKKSKDITQLVREAASDE